MVPKIAQRAALHEKLQKVAPNAMAVKTAEKPYKPFATSTLGAFQRKAMAKAIADPIAAHIAALHELTANPARKNIPVTQDLIRNT